MSATLFREYWNQKPDIPPKLDTGWKYHKHIHSFYIMGREGVWYNLVTGQHVTNQSAIFSDGYGPYGRAAIKTTSASANGLALPVYPPSGSTNRLFMGRFNLSAVAGANDHLIMTYGQEGVNGQRWSFKVFRTTSVLRIEIEGSGYNSSLGVSANTWFTGGCLLDGTTLGDHVLFYNDQSESATGAGTVNTNTTDLPVVYGHDHATILLNTGAYGGVDWFAWFQNGDTELFTEIYNELYKNPWQALEPQYLPLFVEAGVAPANWGKSNPLSGPLGGPLAGSLG